MIEVSEKDRQIMSAILKVNFSLHHMKHYFLYKRTGKIGCSKEDIDRVLKEFEFDFNRSRMIYLIGEYVTELLMYEFQDKYKAVPWQKWENDVLQEWSNVFPDLPFNLEHVQTMWIKMGISSEKQFSLYSNLLKGNWSDIRPQMEEFAAAKLGHMLNRYVLHHPEIKSVDHIPRAFILLCRHYNIPAQVDLPAIEKSIKVEKSSISKCKAIYTSYFNEHRFVFNEHLTDLLQASGAMTTLLGGKFDTSSLEDFLNWEDTNDIKGENRINAGYAASQENTLNTKEGDGEEFSLRFVAENDFDEKIPEDCDNSAESQVDKMMQTADDETINTVPLEILTSNISDTEADDVELPKKAEGDETMARAHQALAGLEKLCQDLFCCQPGCLCFDDIKVDVKEASTKYESDKEQAEHIRFLEEENAVLRRQLDDVRRSALEERDVGVRKLISQLSSNSVNFVLSKLYAKVYGSAENQQAIAGYSRNLFRALEMIGLKPEAAGRVIGEEFTISRDEIGRHYMFEHPPEEPKQVLPVRFIAPGWSWNGKTVVVPLVEKVASSHK